MLHCLGLWSWDTGYLRLVSASGFLVDPGKPGKLDLSWMVKSGFETGFSSWENRENDDLSGIRMGKLGEKTMILNMSNRRNDEQWDYNGISLGLYDIIGGYNGIYIIYI